MTNIVGKIFAKNIHEGQISHISYLAERQVTFIGGISDKCAFKLLNLLQFSKHQGSVSSCERPW